MIIHWLPFLAALLLLCLPPWLPGQARRRLAPNRRPLPASALGMVRLPSNWWDFARAMGGTWLLLNLAISVGPDVRGLDFKLFCLKATLLVIGVAVQTVRYHQAFVFIAPVFYLCGITLILPGIQTGAFALFTGWVFASGGKNPHLVLPVMAVGAVAGGYLLAFNIMVLGLLVVICLLPYVLGKLFETPVQLIAYEGAK